MTKDARGVRKKSVPLTSQQIRAIYVAPLVQLASRLGDTCNAMDEAGIESIRPIPGGIETALGQLEVIVRREFEDRVEAGARKAARASFVERVKRLSQGVD